METLRTRLKTCSGNKAEGVVCYKIIHNNTSGTIRTSHKIRTDEWDRRAEMPRAATRDNARTEYINGVRKSIEADIRLIGSIMQSLDKAGKGFKADDIVRIFRDSNDEHCMYGLMNATANSLRRAGRTRTAETYLSAMRSFMRFAGNRKILPGEIDNNMMMQYETFLKAKGICRNTSSFYMRIMRATYNRAVEKGLAKSRHPFKRVYTGVEKTMKRAVTMQTIRRIKNAALPDEPSLKLARDMFMFSFYTRGMSFVDMAFLKKDDLKNGLLSYRRRKTGQRLYIKWEQCMQDIIDMYPTNDSVYLLPIITGGNDATRQYRNAQHLINSKLKRLMSATGCEQPLTMYVARHSWASIAHSRHIPLSVICECMGHDSETTTRIYLASLDTSETDRANKKILDELQDSSE